MKHYIPTDTCTELPRQASFKTHNIDILVADADTMPSTEILAELYRALNTLIEGHVYTINIRQMDAGTVGDPLYWHGRTAIFWGDINESWQTSTPENIWLSQIINLSPRTILVGGAVLLLEQAGRAHGTTVAIHPNFAAAAQEIGLRNCGTSTCRTEEGRIHSASSRLSALRLLAKFVSLDHGAYISQQLCAYIGLTETGPKIQSPLAIQLIQRSGADPLVQKAVEAMLDHIEDPLKIPDISVLVGTSTRQLQRRFLSKTRTKLLSTYIALRLERVHDLLRHTDLSQREISAATGFTSVTTMVRSFRCLYDKSPEMIRGQRFTGCP